MAREKEEHGGLRKAKMPNSQFERNEGELGKTCQIKYATEFGNPKDLDRSTDALANYVKSHKMKY